MPIKYVFRDNQKPWFIHAEARLVDGSQEPSVSSSIFKSQIRHCFGSDKSLEGENKSRTKPMMPKHDSRNLASFGNREFLGPSEPETVTRSSPLSIPRECFVLSETVSKKLTVAANNIRMQGKSHLSSSLSSSIYRSKTCRKRSLDGKTITSLAKFLVFEISDTEDWVFKTLPPFATIRFFVYLILFTSMLSKISCNCKVLYY